MKSKNSTAVQQPTHTKKVMCIFAIDSGSYSSSVPSPLTRSHVENGSLLAIVPQELHGLERLDSRPGTIFPVSVLMSA